MTTKRGSLRSSQYCQASSVPTSTPDTASTTTTAASATCSADLTSPTKSVKPGVSRKLILQSLYSMGMTEVEMEILRRRSSSSKSETVAPSSTLPRRLMTPVLNRTASASEVLPDPP